jgi:DNA-binding PadR family transcriptional regulator
MIYVILGFLMMKQMTKYDIKSLLSRKISPFYASSYGSINNGIKKLLELNYIDFTETIMNGRHKKNYFLLTEGEEAFINWLKQDIVIGKHKDDLSLKLFFYGFLTIEERIQRLETYYVKQLQHYQEYTAYYNETLKIDYPKEVADIASCQIMTLDYAAKHLACDIEWLETVIKRLKEEANE